MENFQYVRQKDIAKQLGVSQVTVSLALRNSNRVSQEMKGRVAEIAQQLGYKLDPSLSALTYWRKGKKSPVFQGILAILSPFSNREEWQNCTTFKLYASGFYSRANQLGYQVEEISSCPKITSPNRLQKILETRGIQGVLVTPQITSKSHIELQWDSFSSVALGFTLESPCLHVVTNHQYSSMLLLMEQLIKWGYKRIGLVITREGNQRVKNGWSAGYQTGLKGGKKPLASFPIFYRDESSKEEFFKWLNKESFDVIVGHVDWDIYEWLSEGNIRCPEDIGLATVSVRPEVSWFTGIDENSHRIGEIAAETLIDMVNRREKGIPTQRKIIQIEGKFHLGSTVLPRI